MPELQSTLFLGRHDLQSKMRSLQVCQHDHQRVQQMRFQLQSLLWFSNGMHRLLRRHVPGWLSMYSRVPCGEVSGQPKQPQQAQSPFTPIGTSLMDRVVISDACIFISIIETMAKAQLWPSSACVSNQQARVAPLTQRLQWVLRCFDLAFLSTLDVSVHPWSMAHQGQNVQQLEVVVRVWEDCRCRCVSGPHSGASKQSAHGPGGCQSSGPCLWHDLRNYLVGQRRRRMSRGHHSRLRQGQAASLRP